MSGRHELPSKRSFYFSLATSTLRFAIIVVLVVGGIVLMNRAFPEQATSALPGPPGSPSPSVTPSVSPSETPTGQPSPQVEGVRIALFNGTSVTGLAGTAAERLDRRFGYVIAQTPEDAPSPVAQTTLYYRTVSDRVEAEALAAGYFRALEVRVARLPSGSGNVDDSVQVAIYLGNDYAATQE